MKKIIACFSMALILTGCATPQPIPIVRATPVIMRPALIAVKERHNYAFQYGSDPALNHAFNAYIKTGKAPNIITRGFIRVAYQVGQQPVITTSPFQQTVISLEPGEQFTNVTSGDPNRWSYSVAVSGVGALAQQHILVKPSAQKLATNMVITTNRRLYNLRLISVMQGATTRNVSFWYPDEMVAHINAATLSDSQQAVAHLPNLTVSQLNFNYQISCPVFGGSPSWRPVRVFDDGAHTYIQFSPLLANRDVPALFIANNNTQELVNYRVKSPYFVVDKIFKQAILVMGVGHAQSRVIVTNRAYR